MQGGGFRSKLVDGPSDSCPWVSETSVWTWNRTEVIRVQTSFEKGRETDTVGCEGPTHLGCAHVDRAFATFEWTNCAWKEGKGRIHTSHDVCATAEVDLERKKRTRASWNRMDHELELSETFLTEIDRVRRQNKGVRRGLRSRIFVQRAVIDALDRSREKNATCSSVETERTAFQAGEMTPKWETCCTRAGRRWPSWQPWEMNIIILINKR